MLAHEFLRCVFQKILDEQLKTSPNWTLYSTVQQWNILSTIWYMFISSGKGSIREANSIASQFLHYLIKAECLKNILREQLNLMEDKIEESPVSLR